MAIRAPTWAPRPDRAVFAATSPRRMLSRACSGVRGQTLILSVPGSERAAVENLRAIFFALALLACIARRRR